ncbi:MAG: hypothetical protein NVSMB9_33560 [Isosphaeraceae bacterium]
MGRASTFSDPRIIAILQRDYIPVAINVAHLVPEESRQRNWGESSRFVESMVRKSGLRTTQKGDAQGYYALSAAGDFYGGINTHDLDEVLALLEGARDRFAARPPRPISLTETELGPEAPVPAGASVLRVFSRIDPLPEKTPRKRLNQSVGRDHLWVLKSEMDRIVSSLSGAEEDADAPETLSNRLVRFHLIDNVRGEPDLWHPEHVQRRSFRVSRVAGTPTTLTVALTGSFSLKMPRGPRAEGGRDVAEMGLEGTLQGLLEIEKNRDTLKTARIFVSAEAWGESTFTRGAPPGKFPLKFAMVLAEDPLSRQIAPQGLMSVGREEYLEPEGPSTR